MAVINVVQPIVRSVIITVVIWIILVSLALLRLRKIPIESRMNEMPKLIILAFSAAIAGTLATTVSAAMFFPQLLDIDMATVYTAGLLGAAISLWWTLAVFWREMKGALGTPNTYAKSMNRDGRKQPRPPQQMIGISSIEELLPTVREFMGRWEQY